MQKEEQDAMETAKEGEEIQEEEEEEVEEEDIEIIVDMDKLQHFQVCFFMFLI
jgi:hypothetical protein